MTYSTRDATKSLRRSAETEPDEDRATLIQSIADYIESTADGYSRETYAEVAQGYIAGYEHATGEAARIGYALRAAGLNL